MHRSRLGGLIIDCQTDDLEVAEAFWTHALGFDTASSSNPEDEGYVILDTGPDEPHIELQSVNHPSRVHLDIETDNVEAEVSRLEKLGARRLEKVRDWWVMEAPTGHRFCVVVAEKPSFRDKANIWQ
jgi:catechol 2,3-dioxygenase-like lactoylglutathione lyase family enzyme